MNIKTDTRKHAFDFFILLAKGALIIVLVYIPNLFHNIQTYHKIGFYFLVRPNFEEAGTAAVGRKHEFIRSESENWRLFREEQNGEDDDGGWRLAGSRRDGERWRPHSPGEAIQANK